MDELGANGMKILVTGSGAPGGPAAILGLKEAGYVVVSVDVDPMAVGRHFSDHFETIEAATSEHFIESILSVAVKHKVDCVLPLVTSELLPLSRNRVSFESENIGIIVSSIEKLEIANSKLLSYEDLNRYTSCIPNFFPVVNLEDIPRMANDLGYPENPVVIKPAIANGSRGVRIFDENVDYHREVFLEKPGSLKCNMHTYLDQLMTADSVPELVLSEYLPGEEVTVDTICKKGEVRVFLSRRRTKIRSGISVAGEFFFDEQLFNDTFDVCRSLKLDGPIGLQFKKSKGGDYKLLEFNPRVQGTSGSSKGLGINFFDLVIKNHFSEEGVPTFYNKTVVSFERYYSEVFS